MCDLTTSWLASAGDILICLELHDALASATVAAAIREGN